MYILKTPWKGLNRDAPKGGHCLTLLSSAVILKHSDAKQLGKERAYLFGLSDHSHPSLREVMMGAQGRNLNIGTEAETMDHST